MKINHFILILFLSTSTLFGQNSKIHIGILKFKTLHQTQKFFSANIENQYKNIMESSESYIVERLLQYKNIEIIERSKLNLVKKELELQKSENFMDGYVVEQGEHIGADYLIYGIFNPDEKNLAISIYSVKESIVKSKKTVPLKANFWGKINYKETIQDAISQMIDKISPTQIPLVEILKGDAKAKEVLVAGGSKNGFKDYDKLFFYYNGIKVVGKDTLKRQITIGQGKIVEVENENFSRVKITKGKKEIKSFYDKGTQIYCKSK